ncbi:MAG TPA: DUF1648 domain-containing protein [Capsulimonadaceae bacterium]|jgi:uncharacterized membrane protein
MKLIPETIALAGLAYMGIVISASLPILPATIPTHFNAAGAADGFGPKDMLWHIPFVGLMLYALFTVIGVLMNLSKPPTRGMTLDRVISLLGWVKVVMVWTMAYLVWATIETALGHITGINSAFAMMPAVAIVGIAIAHTIGGNKQPRATDSV